MEAVKFAEAFYDTICAEKRLQETERLAFRIQTILNQFTEAEKHKKQDRMYPGIDGHSIEIPICWADEEQVHLTDFVLGTFGYYSFNEPNEAVVRFPDLCPVGYFKKNE